jgi:hypothetical protein
VFGVEQIDFYIQKLPDELEHYLKFLIGRQCQGKMPTKDILTNLTKLKISKLGIMPYIYYF